MTVTAAKSNSSNGIFYCDHRKKKKNNTQEHWEMKKKSTCELTAIFLKCKESGGIQTAEPQKAAAEAMHGRKNEKKKHMLLLPHGLDSSS